MKAFTIEGKLGASKILTGAGVNELRNLAGSRNAVVITDRNVLQALGGLPLDAPAVEVEPGEGAKTLDSARSVYMRLVRHEVDRSGLIVGFGGGVVCDLAGFVASTYLRGIAFGFVPTTLLAQVDAAIGGKNGINLEGYKNIIGTFTQPEFVLCDTALLRTLPATEMRSGLAEALKAGAIGDKTLFELVEANAERLGEYDEVLIREIVERSVAVKAAIVSRDEREAGERRLLNFGHTFGHALERAASVPHGAAVAMGMIVAAKLSAEKGLLGIEDANRIASAVVRLGFEMGSRVDIASAVDAMRKDKKRYGDSIEFVLLDGLGSAVTKAIKIEELEGVAHDLHKHLGIG